MAAVAITAANVALSGTGQTTISVTAGGAITQGQVVRVNNGQYVEADHTTSTLAQAAGVSLTKMTAASDGGVVVTEGLMYIGGTLTKGATYYLGGSAGTLVPFADLTAGDYITPVGVAYSTNQLYVLPYASGQTI